MCRRFLPDGTNSGFRYIEIPVVLPDGEGCSARQEFMSQDLGQEDVRSYSLFKEVAAD
jgi:hypothetical protein